MAKNNPYSLLDRNNDYAEFISNLKNGGGNMEWQHEYIRNLNDDVRAIRSETQKMRQDFHAELNAMRSEINQTIDSKINSFLAEMRDRDNQRHEEIFAIQNRIDASVQSIKNEISSVKGEINSVKSEMSST